MILLNIFFVAMISRIHRKKIIYYEDEGCWQYSSKYYYNKNYDKTSPSKHERKTNCFK